MARSNKMAATANIKDSVAWMRQDWKDLVRSCRFLWPLRAYGMMNKISDDVRLDELKVQVDPDSDWDGGADWRSTQGIVVH